MSDTEELPKSVRQQIERNRQKAIIIRKSKLVAHPYAKGEVIREDVNILKIGAVKYKDTGGGFLLEEQDETNKFDEKVVTAEAAAPPIIETDRPDCQICNKQFAASWLFDKYEFKCCDSCRDPETHKLITKTEAKDKYLLKDCDFDKRGPPLKFIQQKNPHNIKWGDMKLYLELQVKKRALEVWGSEEQIEEEKESREEKRVLSKTKKYEKQLKELRKGMRSSLYDRTSAASHTHTFNEETYNEEDDTYHRKCTTCSYEETFEKM